MDINGVVAGVAGLVCVWALFLLAYTAALRLSLALMRPGRVPLVTLV